MDARAHHDAKWQLERYAPSLFEVISSVSSDQISRYSEDTNTIGTNFSLSDEEVDRLIAAGRKVLRAAAELKAFLREAQDRQSDQL